MEDNLILEGLLSMVTELKGKLEAQVTPASREETLERLGAIEQALSELHSNPAVPEKELQAIQSQLADIRNAEQEQADQSGRIDPDDFDEQTIIDLFGKAGSTFLKACGRMMRRIVLPYERPRLLPASI